MDYTTENGIVKVYMPDKANQRPQSTRRTPGDTINHKGHAGHKGCLYSFVSLVSFVVELFFSLRFQRSRGETRLLQREDHNRNACQGFESLGGGKLADIRADMHGDGQLGPDSLGGLGSLLGGHHIDATDRK